MFTCNLEQADSFLLAYGVTTKPATQSCHLCKGPYGTLAAAGEQFSDDKEALSLE